MARARTIIEHLAAGTALAAALMASPVRADRTEVIYAFRNFSDEPPTRMILVGEIQSKTKMPEVHEESSPFRGYDTRLDQITVKVVNRRGIKVGQKLYVIDKDPFHSEYRNGLIVGEIEVTALLYSSFYGWVLTGKGILLRVRKGQFIARTLDTENLERAYILKKRGDHFANQGNFERAIASYNDALAADAGLPEAHAALGDIYFQLTMDDGGRATPERALDAYRRAYEHRVNFQYEHDAFVFYSHYMAALQYMYNLRRLEASRDANLVQYLDRIVMIAAEARRLNDSPEIRTALARAHYDRMIYYSPQEDAEERRNFDESWRETGQLLKGLIENDEESGELYRIALLYYGRLYEQFRNVDSSEGRAFLGNLCTRLHVFAERYNIYNPPRPGGERDPEVESILRNLPRCSE